MTDKPRLIVTVQPSEVNRKVRENGKGGKWEMSNLKAGRGRSHISLLFPFFPFPLFPHYTLVTSLG